MKLEAVESSTISAVGYDFDTRELIVQFRHGGLYKYFDVPAILYRALLEPHPWHKVGDIVLAHDFEKLD